MMSHLSFILFATTGRIRRRDFWIGLIIVILATVIGTIILQPDYFVYDVAQDQFPPPSLSSNIFGLAMYFPSFAITVKRLNDRDWPRWLTYVVVAVWVPFAIGPFFGLFWDVEHATPVELVGWAVFGPLLVFLLVDNGFFKGTAGPNRYGEDPLGQSA